MDSSRASDTGVHVRARDLPLGPALAITQTIEALDVSSVTESPGVPKADPCTCHPRTVAGQGAEWLGMRCALCGGKRIVPLHFDQSPTIAPPLLRPRFKCVGCGSYVYEVDWTRLLTLTGRVQRTLHSRHAFRGSEAATAFEGVGVLGMQTADAVEARRKTLPAGEQALTA